MSHRARKQNVARSALFRLTPGRPPRNSGENGRGPNGGPGRRARAARSGSDAARLRTGEGARARSALGRGGVLHCSNLGNFLPPCPASCGLSPCQRRPSAGRPQPTVLGLSPSAPWSPNLLTNGVNGRGRSYRAGEPGRARPWPGQGKKSLDRISRSRWGTKKEVAWARLP